MLHDNPVFSAPESTVKWEYMKKIDVLPDPHAKIAYILDQMERIWPDSVKPYETRRPNISKNDLFKELSEYVASTNHTKDEILARIIIVNNALREMSIEQLFGSKAPCKRRQNMYTKAHARGFFLNLDCLFPPSAWVAKLECI